MASNVVTIHDIPEAEENKLQNEIAKEIKKTLGSQNSFWSGIQWFLDWVRNHVSSFLRNQLANCPIVGRWASRISLTVTEFVFTFTTSLFHYLRLVYTAPGIWGNIHQAALRAWEVNEGNGLLAQTYAYGKKMASYFLEIFKQCFEKAIRAKGLELSAQEKDEVAKMLGNVLPDD